MMIIKLSCDSVVCTSQTVVLEQVGRQICRQTGRKSDNKLYKATGADGEADRFVCKKVADK